jgi:quercetin dioxygenase-like cupin family protein
MALVVLVCAGGLTVHAAQPEQLGIKRTALQQRDLSIAGRELVQVRVDFAPGSAFPEHSHPGEEIAYVIEGSLEYRLENQPPVTLKTGEVLFIPAGVIHAARNVGSGNAAKLATYIVEKGKPLVLLSQ